MLTRRELIASTALIGLSKPAKASLMLGGSGSTTPPPDPLTTLLATMIPGQWMELTGPNSGNFTSQLLARTRANFDAGIVADHSTANTFASDAVVPSGIDTVSAPGSLWGFSASTIRRSDGMIAHIGGGHVSTKDNGVYGFNTKAACASILATGIGGNWFTIKRAGSQRAQTWPRPSWSVQAGSSHFRAPTTGNISGLGATAVTGVASLKAINGGYSAAAGWFIGAGTNLSAFQTISSTSGSVGSYTVNFGPGSALGGQSAGPVSMTELEPDLSWADLNLDGQQCMPAGHSYWLHQFHPTNGLAVFSTGGANLESGDDSTNCAEIVNVDVAAGTPGQSFLVTHDNTGPLQPWGYGGPVNTSNPDICDLDGILYAWDQSGFFDKYSNCTTASPTRVRVGLGGSGFPQDSVHWPAIIINDPVNGPTKRAFYSLFFDGATYHGTLVPDIQNVAPVITSWVWSSPVTDPDAAGGSVGVCYDSLRNRIVQSPCTKRLQFFNFNGSNLSASTWTIETGPWHGDVPVALASGMWTRMQYLPTYDAYLMDNGGRVWLRKP